MRLICHRRGDFFAQRQEDGEREDQQEQSGEQRLCHDQAGEEDLVREDGQQRRAREAGGPAEYLGAQHVYENDAQGTGDDV